jgi:hypothetical protein
VSRDEHDCAEPGCAEPGHHHFPGVDPHRVLPDAAGDASPAEVLELAASCVRFVAAAVKLAPDFTPETLSLVDHYVREAKKTLGDRPEALPLTANAVGAYLGEVIRRTHRCWWRTDGDPSGWRLEFEAALISFYPMEVAHALLAPTADDDQFSGFEMEEDDRADVYDRLAELPPVSEEEYMLPSLRLEVLDIALETLVARHIEEPHAKRGYRPEDYAERA